jgi:hypothetical protein
VVLHRRGGHLGHGLGWTQRVDQQRGRRSAAPLNEPAERSPVSLGCVPVFARPDQSMRAMVENEQ